MESRFAWLMVFAVAGVCVLLGRYAMQQGRGERSETRQGAAFRWVASGVPIVTPRQSQEDEYISIKDPTVVWYQGRWHLFCTVRGRKRSHQIEYFSFEDWSRVDEADRTMLNITEGYYCAPQVFYFQPQGKWYLIYQTVAPPGDALRIGPAYSTTEDISDPASWTGPRMMFDEHPTNITGWLDFWVICDDETAYLFFTSMDGRMWRAQTPVADFPNGWSRPEVVLLGDIYEAGHVYKIKGMQKYLAVVEAKSWGRRYYKAYVADRLDGSWAPLAASRTDPFAGRINTAFPDQAWTDSVSHGELIRAGHDQRLEIEPTGLRFLFQGAKGNVGFGTVYSEIPWCLGMLEMTADSTAVFD